MSVDALNLARTKLEWRSEQLKSLKKTRAGLKAGLEDLAREVIELQDSLAVCDVCIREQVSVKSYIEELTTALLTFVFQEPIRFELTPGYDDAGNMNSLTPQIDRWGVARGYAKEGGGATNLMSFAIRIACLMLKTELSPILFLDESNLNIDKDKQERLILFLEDLASKKNLQIIAITHSDMLFPQTLRVTIKRKKAKIRVVA